MKTLRQILAEKSGKLITVAPDDPVFHALQVMSDANVGAVLVLDGEKLVGVLSERDYARKVVLQGRSSKDTPVRDIMTAQVISVGPQDSADHCMQLVTDSRIRHLPVLEGGQVIGVVSIGDLVKAVIEEQRQELDHLQRYIAS